jgi:hypothetical protein
MVIKIKLTDGLHCKACDVPLDGADPELCGECIAVVCQMNEEVYTKDDEEFADDDESSEVDDESITIQVSS